MCSSDLNIDLCCTAYCTWNITPENALKTWAHKGDVGCAQVVRTEYVMYTYNLFRVLSLLSFMIILQVCSRAERQVQRCLCVWPFHLLGVSFI